MTRRDPFSDVEELFERMDRELEKLGAGLDVSGRSDVAVDLIEGDEELTVLADLPGFDDDELSVELRDETLVLGATPSDEGSPDGADADASEADDTDGSEADDADVTEAGDADATEAGDADASGSDDGDRYHLRERRHGSVSRRIPLPAAVEPSAATAAYDAGVLTVTLPKRSASADDGHRIDVS